MRSIMVTHNRNKNKTKTEHFTLKLNTALRILPIGNGVFITYLLIVLQKITISYQLLRKRRSYMIDGKLLLCRKCQREHNKCTYVFF